MPGLRSGITVTTPFRRLAFAASSDGGNHLLGIGEEIGMPERTGLIDIEHQADALAVIIQTTYVNC